MKEHYYKIFFEKSPTPYAYCRAIMDESCIPYDYEFLEVNEAYEKMAELNASAIVGKRFKEVFPTDHWADSGKWYKAFKEAIMNNKTVDIDLEYYWINKFLRISVIPLGGKDFACIFKNVEKDYLQDKDIEGFLKFNLDMLCVADTGGNFLRVNRVFENVLGYRVDELEGKSFLSLIHENDIPATLKAIKQLEEEKLVLGFINRYRCKDGSIRYLEWRAMSKGKYIYASARDITDNKTAEENLIKYQKLLQEKNKLIESILDNAPLGIWLSGEEPGSIFINKFIMENFNLTEEEITSCIKTDKDAFEKDSPQYFEEILTFQDNKKHTVGTVKTKVYNEAGSILGILGIGLDITKRKEAEDALRISEEKYRLIAENTSDVIWVLNLTQSRFTYVSPCIKELTGYTAEETTNEGLNKIMTSEYKEIIDEGMVEALTEFVINQKASCDPFEAQIFHKNGEVIWIESSIKFRYNSENEIEVVGVSRNIERRKKAEKEVLYLSYHDQLTGLYNRRFYEEKLKRINTEKNLPITLVMADVNGLKLTNDAFGHATGDLLLKNIAEVLKKECREGDVIARIGGDEFVILLPKTDCQQGEKIVSRISEAISNKKLDKSILSVSFGLYTKTKVEESFDEIYKKAEDFMYHRKLLESTSVKNDIIKLTTKTLYEKDMMEQLHSKVVSEFCKKIGAALGFSPDDINELGLAGLLHDIGKIGVDERLLNKPGKFNEDEWKDMKRHPEIGYQILKSVNEFSETAEYVLAHHERLDGKGYPRGLKEDEIPLISKIICVADAYDSMIGNYVEKTQLSVEAAIKEMKVNAGTQFDPEIARVFVEKVLGKEW